MPGTTGTVMMFIHAMVRGIMTVMGMITGVGAIIITRITRVAMTLAGFRMDIGSMIGSMAGAMFRGTRIVMVMNTIMITFPIRVIITTGSTITIGTTGIPGIITTTRRHGEIPM